MIIPVSMEQDHSTLKAQACHCSTTPVQSVIFVGSDFAIYNKAANHAMDDGPADKFVEPPTASTPHPMTVIPYLTFLAHRSTLIQDGGLVPPSEAKRPTPNTLPNQEVKALPVHQLDAPTSGSLLVAYSRCAAARFAKCFERRAVSKTYLAVVAGVIPIPTSPVRADSSGVDRANIDGATTEASSTASYVASHPAVRLALSHDEALALVGGPSQSAGGKRPRNGGDKSCSDACTCSCDPTPFSTRPCLRERSSTVTECDIAAARTLCTFGPWAVSSACCNSRVMEVSSSPSLVCACAPVAPSFHIVAPTGKDASDPRGFAEASALPWVDASVSPVGSAFLPDVSVVGARAALTSVWVVGTARLSQFYSSSGMHEEKSGSIGTEVDPPCTVVLLKPLTGRRHQLRVHMALLGYPIVGDATYFRRMYERLNRAGDDCSGNVMYSYGASRRLFLHSWKLMLPRGCLPPRPYVRAPNCICTLAGPRVTFDALNNSERGTYHVPRPLKCSDLTDSAQFCHCTSIFVSGIRGPCV